MQARTQAFLLFGVLPVVLLQNVGAWLYFVAFDGSPYAQPLYFATKFAIVGILIAWMLFHAPLPALRMRSWRAVGIGTLHGVGLVLAIGAAYVALAGELGVFADVIAVKINDFPVLAEHFLLAAVAFSLGHALFEEISWRWFVVHGLAHAMRPMRAVLLGNLAFTAHHVIILSQFFSPALTIMCSIGVFVAGVLWSLLYQKTGSLTAPWISHVLADAAIFGIGYTLIG